MEIKEQFMRTGLLLGEEGIRKLNKAAVAVFGIGGVGGFTVEALARSGIGHLVLVDADEVSESNINRQIIATHQTVGRPKVEVMKERIPQINPEAAVDTSVCPLAKVMRKELKKRNVPALKVVYSKEKAMEPAVRISEDGKRQIPVSTAFVPSVAGLIIAGEVIKDLSGISEK